jgi:V/A-type H+-transporting ATPase subunit I
VPHVFLTLRNDPSRPVVWLAGPKSNADVLDRAARSAYLDPLQLPADYQGTPGDIIKSLRNTIESTQRRLAELQETLNRIGKERQKELRDLLWQAHTSRVLSDAIVRYGQLKHTYVVTGWVPSDSLEELTRRLKQASPEILIETLPTSRTSHNSNVPVALFNNRYLRPFQMLVNTYARPRYGEIDPSILIAITFPILYGAMFGDLGQGLVLFTLGLLMHNKVILKGMSGLRTFHRDIWLRVHTGLAQPDPRYFAGPGPGHRRRDRPADHRLSAWHVRPSAGQGLGSFLLRA